MRTICYANNFSAYNRTIATKPSPIPTVLILLILSLKINAPANAPKQITPKSMPANTMVGLSLKY